MMILLGSESAQKLEILKSSLKNLTDGEPEIFPYKVDSGISKQPLDKETTIRGSVNRARNAALEHGKIFDLSFGMEGGLVMAGGIYNLVCVAAIMDGSGKIAIGKSAPISLPKEMSDRVLAGENFSEVIREYDNRSGLGDEEKALVSDLIGRRKSFSEAIEDAWKNFNLILFQ